MEIIIFALIIVLVSYVLAERAFRIRRRPVETMLFLTYGTEFFLIGLLVGPYFLGILTTDMIDHLEPLINIALGWIGLLFGFQFRMKDLKLLSMSNYLIAGTEALVTFIAVTILFVIAGLALAGPVLFEPNVISCAIILGAIATVSSPAVVASVVKRIKAHGRASRLVRYTTGFDNLLGLIAFGLAYPFFHFTAQRGDAIIPGWGWLIISIAAGLVLGILFHFFTLPRASSNENLMIAVGMVTLSTGIASYLHLSALFINLIVGVVLCNYSERQDRFYRLLVSAEKPLYGILLIIASALWRASWPMMWVTALFILFRASAKTLGGWLSLKRYRHIVKHPEWFGSSLFAQGGMSLAIALDYRFLAPGETSSMFVAVVLTSLAINGLACQFAAARFLRLEGDAA